MRQIKILTTAVMIWAGTLLCHAAVDSTQLATNIIQIVGVLVTNVDKTQLQHAAWKISDSMANSPSDSDSLISGLETAFQKTDYAFLNWNNNSDALKTAATNIATEICCGYASPNLGALLSPVPVSGTNHWLLAFSSGAQFLNPYNIIVPKGATRGPNGTLTNAGSSTVAYLQLDLLRRGVFAADTFQGSGSCDGWIWHQWPPTPDVQVQLGFLLGNGVNSASNNTYSAQALAGSDIYLQLGLGIPIYRNNWQTEDPIRFQFSIGGSWGVTTEESFEVVHLNQFYGGVCDFGIPFSVWGSATNQGITLIEAKGGIAEVDFPSLSGVNNQVNLDGNGVPNFNQRWEPEIGVNALIPIGNNVFLNTEADTFIGNQRPNQWRVKVGMTIPFDKIPKMITGLAGAGS